MHYELLLWLWLSLALWITIWLEREKKWVQFGGVRTFTLVSLLGFLSWLIADTLDNSLFVIAVSIGIFVMLWIVYYNDIKKQENYWMTSEIAMFLMFAVGLLVYQGEHLIAVIATIVMLVFLSANEWLHNVAHAISKEELTDSIKFAIIAFVILPLLPNEAFWPFWAFNPYEIRLMVVFISWIWYVWYFLTKIVWAKNGIWLTWMIWWLVSSTAVTLSLSELSAKAKNDAVNPYVFGVVISGTIMFARMGLSVYVFNQDLFLQLIVPLAVMTTVGLIISGFRYRRGRNNKNEQTDIPVDSPFSLKPALIFAWLFALITLLSKIWLEYFSENSLYLIALISGLTDVDAITLTIANLETLTASIAVWAVLTAAASNTAVKAGMAYTVWNKSFWLKVIASFLLILVSGGLTMLFL